MGKHTLFFGPLGLFMRFLGGIPVNRRKKNDYVTLLSKEIKSKTQCILSYPRREQDLGQIIGNPVFYILLGKLRFLLYLQD